MTLAPILTKISPLRLELKKDRSLLRLFVRFILSIHMYRASVALGSSLCFYPHHTYIMHTGTVYTIRTTCPSRQFVCPIPDQPCLDCFFTQQSHSIHFDLRVDRPQSHGCGTETTQVKICAFSYKW